jgi:hypothetical protein
VQEALPGVFHWTGEHPVIHVQVHSYWIEDGGVLIDPVVPVDVGLDWFAQRPGGPTSIVLSNRHHYRESRQFVERFGCEVRVPRSGLHEFADRGPVRAYDPGENLAGGLVVHEVGAICPDDMALHRPASQAVWFADGLVRGGQIGGGGPLGFVPDSFMDAPEQTKHGLLASFRRLLDELEFEHVLLAHGGPVVGEGRALLEELVQAGGRTAFEM